MWNIYTANNLWLAYRIERQNSRKTRTDNLFAAVVFIVWFIFRLVHKWIVADCYTDQCWTIIKSHHQKVAQLFIIIAVAAIIIRLRRRVPF